MNAIVCHERDNVYERDNVSFSAEIEVEKGFRNV